MGISLEAGHTQNASIGSRRRVRTYPSSSINLYILHMKPRQCTIMGYTPAGMCFNSISTCHTSDTFHVCYEVMSVNTAEPRSTMRDGDRRNTGKLVDHGLVMEWSVAGAAEWSGIKKNKGKIVISSHYVSLHHNSPLHHDDDSTYRYVSHPLLPLGILGEDPIEGLTKTCGGCNCILSLFAFAAPFEVGRRCFVCRAVDVWRQVGRGRQR